MAFYDLSKAERNDMVKKIHDDITLDLTKGEYSCIFLYFSDEDTYIRKTAYLSIGRIYFECTDLKARVLSALRSLSDHEDHKIRQTVINGAGEIGKRAFEQVVDFFDKGLLDEHHSPRNAVIGSIKKMGDVNPKPVLGWARGYLDHPDKEIRREICHGIELRGRKHPEDILPLLKKLQFDPTSRVYKTLVHVLGQIAYKKDCLEKVVEELKTWENDKLVADALEEIIDVHDRYKDFSYYSQAQAKRYIQDQFY